MPLGSTIEAFARRLSFRKPNATLGNTSLKTPLHFAAVENEQAALTEHISSGCNVDAVDELGNTPLHLACRHGHVDIAKALLLITLIVPRPGRATAHCPPGADSPSTCLLFALWGRWQALAWLRDPVGVADFAGFNTQVAAPGRPHLAEPGGQFADRLRAQG